MLTNLLLENFKSWEKTGNIRLAPITGLFGTNSSGKTGFLQLLLMLKQTTESPDRSQVINFGDDRSAVQLGSFKDIIFKHQKLSLKFGLDWLRQESLSISDQYLKSKRKRYSDKKVNFSAEISENASGDINLDKMTYGFISHKFGMKRKPDTNQYTLFAEGSENESLFEFKRTRGRVWDLPAPIKFYGFPDQVRYYYKNAGYLSEFDLAFESLMSNIYYLGPLREYPRRQYIWAGNQPYDMGQRGERVIDALLASRERNTVVSRGRGRKPLTVEEYVAHWLKQLKLIHSFKVQPIAKGSNLYQVLVKRTSDSAEVLITDVGFGVSQILPVIAICYYVPEGSTILMEQPEIHLHPSVQAGLADVLIDAIKVRNVQIILESHSEHLLRRLQRRIAEEIISKDNAALYFCEYNANKSILTELKMDLYGNIENWPKDFFGDDVGEMAAISNAIQNRIKRMGN